MRRTLMGSAVGVLASVGLGAAMVPLRSHLSLATSGLALVIPVVAGVTVGGFNAGLVSAAAGFLVYDFALIPPYYTLTVGAARNWAALAVYVIVMALVSRVVARLDEARMLAHSREVSARHLFELSELLLGDKSVPELAQAIVDAVRQALDLTGAVLLVSVDDRLEVVATSGQGITEAALGRLRPEAGLPVPLRTEHSGLGIQTLALAASGRPVGLLVLAGVPSAPATNELMPTLANHLALALERSQLHERVRQAELLEEVDRLRHALVGAVSHDLRTPLSTIKVASSTLLDPEAVLSVEDTGELHALIDMQADRLTNLVTSLLDMTRIQAGVLEPRRQACSMLDLAAAAITSMSTLLQDRAVDVEVPPLLPLVDVDHLLVEQVISNLIDNADRHSPPGSSIRIGAEVQHGDRVAVSVTDSGPGIPPAERQAVFDSFVRFDDGGRAGLGLAIAKAFVEAHGERIWVEQAPGGGARFVFSLPLARSDGEGE
jgi:two-component system sensor histidine kinase KdpD